MVVICHHAILIMSMMKRSKSLLRMTPNQFIMVGMMKTTLSKNFTEFAFDQNAGEEYSLSVC